MNEKSVKGYCIISLLVLSSMTGAFELQDVISELGSVLNLIHQSAEDAVNQGTSELLNIPAALGDRLSCTPCSLISEFVMNKIDENVYIQSLIISVCPVLFYGDWHKIWACEVLMAGVVVYSHFGSPPSLCRAMGMCPNLFKTKRNTMPSSGDPEEIYQLLPLAFDHFSKKLSTLDPMNYIKAKKTIYKIVSRAGKQTMVEYTNSLRDLSQLYR